MTKAKGKAAATPTTIEATTVIDELVNRIEESRMADSDNINLTLDAIEWLVLIELLVTEHNRLSEIKDRFGYDGESGKLVKKVSNG